VGGDHGVFLDPYPLKQRPEIFSISDGLRPILFYAMDDISCYWQTKAYTTKEYLFKFGINLFTVATDHSPLRAALAAPVQPTPRYTGALRAGPKTQLRLARLKYDGAWATGRQYKGLPTLKTEIGNRAHVDVRIEEDGLDPSALENRDVAYLVGCSDAVAFSDAERDALKAYLGKGGFLWVEAAGGSPAFDQAFRKLAADWDWKLKPFDKTSPMITGKFKKAAGYDLTTGVQFRHELRKRRIGRPFAEMTGIYQNGKFVGVYSPFDVVFSSTPYDAYACLGYQPEDAAAVASNLALYLSERTPTD